MLRQEMPRISAACHHCSCPLMALRITCCTFIVRSTAGIGYPSIEPPLVEGGVLILPERTVHLLFPAAISLVIDSRANYSCGTPVDLVLATAFDVERNSNAAGRNTTSWQAAVTISSPARFRRSRRSTAA